MIFETFINLMIHASMMGVGSVVISPILGGFHRRLCEPNTLYIIKCCMKNKIIKWCKLPSSPSHQQNNTILTLYLTSSINRKDHQANNFLVTIGKVKNLRSISYYKSLHSFKVKGYRWWYLLSLMIKCWDTFCIHFPLG